MAGNCAHRFVLCAMLAWLPAHLCLAGETPAQVGGEYDNAKYAKGEAVCNEFNTAAKAIFGAEKEPLVYEKFGKELKVVDKSLWMHVSENSACIAWQTNIPAKTYVEFGASGTYGKKTVEAERHYYIHVHYVTGLETGKPYHYRLVSVDERGNKVVGEDAVLETKKTPGAVYLPGDMGEPPYSLDKPNTTYVLTKDVVAQTKGVEIKASGVTLDLNGHTITYDEGEPKVKVAGYKVSMHNNEEAGYTDAWAKYTYSDQATFGLRVNEQNLNNLKIFNGSFIQGKNRGRGIIGFGFNPIYIKWPSAEVAGVTLVYSGDDLSGLVVANGKGTMDVHHNVIVDQGTRIANRHQAVRALEVAGGFTRSSIHHNLVKRCRQNGISACNGTEVFANEVYVDSYATNSFALGVGDDTQAYDNRLFGTGYHPIGIGIGYINTKNRVFHGNFIQMQGTPYAGRWTEFGEHNSAKGIRLQKGPTENIEFYDNTVVVKGKGECAIRGLWIVPQGGAKNILIRDCTVKVITEDLKTDQWGALCALGDPDAPSNNVPFPENAIVYRNCVFISNLCNVRLGDDYGIGWMHRLFQCKFIKAGNNPRYQTIWCGWPYGNQNTFGHWLIDPVFEGGAGLDKVKFAGEGPRRDFAVGWTVTVKTAPGAKVSIADKTGKTVFSGVADEKGAVSTPLLQSIYKPEGIIALTPHKIVVEKDGKTTTKELTVDRGMELAIP
jgi:hypothetical protein